MPRRFFSMSDLLWQQRREQDRAVREAVKGALTKREVAKKLYPHASFWKEQ